MGDTAETAASRLWRDRAQLREQERNEVQARTRVAEEKVATLTAENDRLASKNTYLRDQNDRLADENARLRTQLMPNAARTRAETEQQMEVLKTELRSLLDQSVVNLPKATFIDFAPNSARNA
jgi:predicted nuclease with TOPRIM domain